MASKKALWIGGGLLVAAAGGITIVALTRDEKSKAKKNGKAKGKDVDTSPPDNTPPMGGADSDGVFRLEGAGLRQVVCDARDAKSGAELARVIRGLQEAVRASGAKQVDVRNSGLIDQVVSTADFNRELEAGAKKVEGLSGFFFPAAKGIVTNKLSGLPDCSASAQTWEAIAAGTMQQAATAATRPEPIWGIPRALEEARPG